MHGFGRRQNHPYQTIQHPSRCDTHGYRLPSIPDDTGLRTLDSRRGQNETKRRRRVHDRRNGLANMHRGATEYRGCRETRLAPRDDRRLFFVEALWEEQRGEGEWRGGVEVGIENTLSCFTSGCESPSHWRQARRGTALPKCLDRCALLASFHVHFSVRPIWRLFGLCILMLKLSSRASEEQQLNIESRARSPECHCFQSHAGSSTGGSERQRLWLRVSCSLASLTWMKFEGCKPSHQAAVAKLCECVSVILPVGQG
jgi:hypothetical protein